VKVCSVSYRLAILTMRWDKSFAYDLVDYHGPVSCRQALLFGSAEGKPEPVARFSPQDFLSLNKRFLGGSKDLTD
jgi:hypothetical protein